MPPKESLFSTLRKTVVFFRLTRTYLRDAALATRARRRLDGVSRRPPQLWCLCYLDTARHICGDAIAAQGSTTSSSGGRLYVSVEPRPKILRFQQYGSKGCDLSLTAFHRPDM